MHVVDARPEGGVAEAGHVAQCDHQLLHTQNPTRSAATEPTLRTHKIIIIMKNFNRCACVCVGVNNVSVYE